MSQEDKESAEQLASDFYRKFLTEYPLAFEASRGMLISYKRVDKDFYKNHKDSIVREIINNDLIPSDLKAKTLVALKDNYRQTDLTTPYPQINQAEISMHLSFITNVCNFINEKIEELKEPQKKSIKLKNELPKTTFQWIGKEEQLKPLWKFIQNNLIKEISFEDFKIIFSITPNRSVKEIKNKIKWKGSLRSLFEFLYFLKKEGKLLPDNFNLSRNTYNLYRRVEYCFANKEGEDFPNVCKGNKKFVHISNYENKLKAYSYPKYIAEIKDKIPKFYP
ncbi:MAG: hypothetical protein HY840_05215 [Bacteroidetes bacterium]|nr:hypothetical protein [Bacteroidota bacterium]